MDGKKHQHVEQIQSTYRRIDDKWLHMQYRLMLVLAVMTTVTETVMFLVLQTLDFVEIPPEKYLIKYLAVLAADNLILSILATVLMRGRFSVRKKIYGISLLMTLMAFSMYTIHAVWVSLMLAFAIPMLMTVVYADQRLTAMVSGLCIVEKAVSDLLLCWDPTRSRVLESENTFLDFVLSLLLLGLFYGICACLIRMEQEKNNVSIDLERQRQRYYMEALTDALTGVWNRQALREAFRRLETQAMATIRETATSRHWGRYCGRPGRIRSARSGSAGMSSACCFMTVPGKSRNRFAAAFRSSLRQRRSTHPVSGCP